MYTIEVSKMIINENHGIHIPTHTSGTMFNLIFVLNHGCCNSYLAEVGWCVRIVYTYVYLC